MSHRVMNSFQLMESMFALQTRRIADPAARQVVAEAEERLRSMSLVHRQLFQLTRDHVQDLDGGAYLHSLARELSSAFAQSNSCRIEVTAGEGLVLSPAQGIALGLLVTELVLNAIKHAFKGQDHGLIRITLESVERSRFRLVVADNGAGLPSSEARTTSSGIGMKLLDGFLRQLDGELTVEGPPGTRFVVLFPREAPTSSQTGDEVQTLYAVQST
jgi:two-component sensor histidine kinase